jgi:hypothetical protein
LKGKATTGAMTAAARTNATESLILTIMKKMYYVGRSLAINAKAQKLCRCEVWIENQLKM